jgi:hypothetical protein
MSSTGLVSEASCSQVPNTNPPPLPPRKLAPALPPRPGAQLRETPVRHDWPSDVDGDAEQDILRAIHHTVSLPTDSALTDLHSREALQTSNLNPTFMLDPECKETLERPAALDTEIPEIVHTAASSPECEPFPGFQMSRSTSSSSMHSTASLSNENAPARQRSGTNSKRPFVELYGKGSAERQYQEALEELQALEVVSDTLSGGKRATFDNLPTAGGVSVASKQEHGRDKVRRSQYTCCSSRYWELPW